MLVGGGRRQVFGPAFQSSPDVMRSAAMIPAMMLSAGEPFAGYTIVRLLGAGAMGEVYLAQHLRLPRREALKVLRPKFLRMNPSASGLYAKRTPSLHWNSLTSLPFTTEATRMDGCGSPLSSWMVRTQPSYFGVAIPTGCRPMKSQLSRLRSLAPWTTPMAGAFCIAMSNPPTSCSPIPTMTAAAVSTSLTSDCPPSR